MYGSWDNISNKSGGKKTETISLCNKAFIVGLEPAKTLEHKYSCGVRANLLESVGTLLVFFFISKEIGLREKKITLFSCSEIGINIVRFRELPGRFVPLQGLCQPKMVSVQARLHLLHLLFKFRLLFQNLLKILKT